MWVWSVVWPVIGCRASVSALAVMSVIVEVDVTEVSVTIVTAHLELAVTRVACSWGTALHVSVTVRAVHEADRVVVIQTVLATYSCKYLI